MARNCAPTDPWQLARNRYMEDLDEGEKTTFATASLENLFYSASAAQKDHEKKSISRAISQRLEPFVSAIDQYGAALEVYTTTYSLAMAPLWGSIRVLLHVKSSLRHISARIAKTFEKYFKKLIDMFTRIGDVLPRCQVYHSLFPSHERLLQAISMGYLDIVHFCINAKAMFRKLKRSTTVHFILKSLWKDFNGEFEETLNEFRNHIKNIEKEAGVSNLIEASTERALARADRVQSGRRKKILERDLLLSQLSSLRYVDKHMKQRKRCHPGTGSWLTQTDEFKEWVTGNRSACLWCCGIPGSGKTVLASSLVDTLSMGITGRDVTVQQFTSQDIINKDITNHETTISYYYCEFSDSKSLETQNILGTITRELLENIIIPDDLEQKINQLYRPGARTAAEDELVSILYAVLKYFSKVYICIDGLDECEKDDQTAILSVVNQLAQTDRAVVKIIITSREETLISTALRGFPRLRVSADKNSLDITAFIEETVESNIGSGALKIRDPSLKSDIISTLKAGADGMFLWVQFQLADLCDAASDFIIRETLRNLPKGMAETYARVLRKIRGSQSNRALAQRIFKWVVCAKRPLLIAELGEAVALGPTDRCWNVEKIPDASGLIQACRSLIVFDEDDKTVRLAHHTVQQFLLEPPIEASIPEFHFQLSQANVEAGETCVAYLSFSDFETQLTILPPNNDVSACGVPSPAAVLDSAITPLGPSYITSSILKFYQYMRIGNASQQSPTFDLAKFAKPRKPPPPELRGKYLFLDYAVENWISHASDFSEENTTMWKAFKYLATEKLTAFDIRIWGDSNTSCDLPYTSLFRWAIGAGHMPLLELLLSLPRGSNLHDYCRSESGKGWSIVLSALSGGHTKVVQLLAKQACIDARYGKPLTEAALNGDEEVVRLLLEYGLSLDGKAEILQKTPRSGHLSAMHVLLRNEPPLDLQIERGKVALAEAAERCSDGALMVLLSQAASFGVAISDLERVWRTTALPGAAERGLVGVVRLLVEKGADVNTSDGERTALSWAAESGQEAVVRLLVEEGADVNAKDVDGWTALRQAVQTRHEAMMRLLIENGADVNSKDSEGWTALFRAARDGDEATMRLLIENGADVNSKDSEGWTALFWAARDGDEATMRLLIENGADVNAKDKKGWTALFRAASDGHEAVVRLLAEEGADVNAKHRDGELTALHRAARSGRGGVVRLLAKKGADISARDGDGLTALHRAAESGHKVMLQLLVENGADVNAEDEDGWTALHRVAKSGHEAVVRLLAGTGANVNAKDKYGRTPLRWAARAGHEAVVWLLIENGADVNARDKYGRPALPWAAAAGFEMVVLLLIEIGADVNAADVDGWTALYRAAESGHGAVTRLLIERGAKVHLKDTDGATALHRAAKYGHGEVVQILLESGAIDNAKDKAGRTALHEAVQNGHEAVVRLLTPLNPAP
ncbi:MAG: hypothetical protein M1839_003580 [Geoglossum umbratile]|nr:MAG: hypothetical protein M1839_003580 [Geoglossum umbratile]